MDRQIGSCLRVAVLALALAPFAPAVAQVCGNGVREPPEQCDDGNRANFDGCSSRCTFEQAQRANQLKMQSTTSASCAANKLGSQTFTSTALTQMQNAIDASVADGSTSVLLYFIDLADLSGTATPNLHMGLFNTTPAPSSPTVTYDGTSDVDWWQFVDETELDTAQNPLSPLSGTLAANVLDAGPTAFPLRLNFGGAPTSLALSSLHINITNGPTLSTPLSYDGTTERGHLPSENLDPALTSFENAGGSGGAATGTLCGNVGAASLAATLIPPSITTSCTSYTAANSLLDLIVGGCTYLGIITIVNPTQPDQVDPNAPVAGAGGPYKLLANATSHIVDTCEDQNNTVVDLQTCLNAAAYSSFFKFSTDRVIAKSTSASDVIFHDGFD